MRALDQNIARTIAKVSTCRSIVPFRRHAKSPIRRKVNLPTTTVSSPNERHSFALQLDFLTLDLSSSSSCWIKYYYYYYQYHQIVVVYPPQCTSKVSKAITEDNWCRFLQTTCCYLLHQPFYYSKLEISQIKFRAHNKPFVTLTIYIYIYICLQCFDAVGWAAGRASGL